MFTQREFDYSQTPEVQSIYNEFVDAFEEKLIIDDFIPVLQNACGDKCQILYKKLLRRKQSKMDLDEFSNLFNFELTEPDNFDCLFEVLDQGKGKITIETLKNANQKYSLGLSDQDIKVMITYTQVKDQPITKSVFKTLIQ